MVPSSCSQPGAHWPCITRVDCLQVPRLLRLAGADKLTFVGGEPLMHPHIESLIAAAKAAGLTTALVTNGACLTADRLLRLKGVGRAGSCGGGDATPPDASSSLRALRRRAAQCAAAFFLLSLPVWVKSPVHR